MPDSDDSTLAAGTRKPPPPQQRFHDVPSHIPEAEVPSPKPEPQLLVVEAEQVQDGGVEVMHVNFVSDHFGAVISHRGDHPGIICLATGIPNGLKCELM